MPAAGGAPAAGVGIDVAFWRGSASKGSGAPPVRPEVAHMRAAIAKLEARMTELHRLHPEAIENRKDPRIEGLSQGIDAALREAFGTDTPDYQRFGSAKNLDRAPFLLNGTPMALVRNGLEQGKAVGISLLEEAVALLQERIAEGAVAAGGMPAKPAAKPAEPAPAAPAGVAPAAPEAPAAPSIIKPAVAEAPPAPSIARAPAPPPEPRPAPIAPAAAAAPGPRDVLIVHGNDTVASGEIARFLRKAEFNAVILHEQGGEALTDIERLERHAGAGFAVVLLPPEDGGKPGFARPRSRQAVTEELFYFIGKLGRAKVCAFSTKEGDEPAVTGIGYAHYDRYEGWQKVLLKTLESAGYAVDWAKALR